MRVSVAIGAVALAIATAPAHHHRRSWWVPPWWRPQAVCIHRHESRPWHREWTLYGRTYANGFSFLLSTWERAGGRRRTWVWASPAEQFYRAHRIWKMDGRSWREWPTAKLCGLS